jgi:outer membrane protein
MRIPLLAAALAALLHAAPAHADVKIGYVDLQRALNEIEEGKSAKAQLKREFDQKQKMLDEKQAEFNRLRGELEKQATVLAESARKERQDDLDRRFQELQTTFAQLQKELSEREREVTRGIFDKMGVIIRETAETESFTMVLERTDAGILYAPPSLDLTNELIRKYNARHKGGVAAAAPKASATPAKADASKAAPAKPAAKGK